MLRLATGEPKAEYRTYSQSTSVPLLAYSALLYSSAAVRTVPQDCLFKTSFPLHSAALHQCTYHFELCRTLWPMRSCWHLLNIGKRVPTYLISHFGLMPTSVCHTPSTSAVTTLLHFIKQITL